MATLFKSEAGKKAILDLYDQKLAALNIPFESLYVDTSFGKTHLLKTGDPSNPPIILVHGSNGCAPIALETYPNLRKHFQVFAVDVIAQPNKSAETRVSMKDNSYGQWMNEIIDELGLDQVILAGFSFGGLIILKTLLYDASKIKEVFLAAPAYLVNGNPLKAMLKIFLPMRRYMKSKEIRHIEQFLSTLFSQRDEFAIQFLSQVFLHFDMDFRPVPVIAKKDARSIQTPITLVAAKQDLMFPGSKMIKRAKKIFPSLKQTVLLEDSKHVQDQEGNRLVEELIVKAR